MNRFSPGCGCCGPVVPATGACHVISGGSCTCTQETAAGCAALGGTYKGNGTDCSTDPCVSSDNDYCGLCEDSIVASTLIAHLTALVDGPDLGCPAGTCDLWGGDKTVVCTWQGCCGGNVSSGCITDEAFTDCGSLATYSNGISGSDCSFAACSEVWQGGFSSTCGIFGVGVNFRIWLAKDTTTTPHKWYFHALLGVNHAALGWIEGALFKSDAVATGDADFPCTDIPSVDLHFVREFHCNLGVNCAGTCDRCDWSVVNLNLAMGI